MFGFTRLAAPRARGLAGVATAAATAAVAVCGFAGSGSAQARAFQRGDVFMDGSTGLQELTPNGGVVQTIAGTQEAGATCVSPSGQYLVIPGVGLFNRFGGRLTSNWTSDGSGGSCLVDGYGNVYVVESDAVHVGEYTITGTLEQTITLQGSAPPQLAIAMGPDPCVLYYAGWEELYGIGRYDVCTDTPMTAFNTEALWDALAVLATGQVIALTDSGASLFDPSGDYAGTSYPSPFEPVNNLRYMALGPGDNSVYLSGAVNGLGLVRYDIHGGLIDEWGEWDPGLPDPQQLAGGPISVYSPPLAGTADIGSRSSTVAAGTATATRVTVGYTGTVTELHVFLAGTAAPATSVQLGLYSNVNGRPGQLLTAGTVSTPAAGQWNLASLPVLVPLTAGQTYWLAVLPPAGSGSLVTQSTAQNQFGWSAGPGLANLPATWSQSKLTYAAVPSAYGS